LERKRLLGLTLAGALVACSSGNFGRATGEGGGASPSPTIAASSEQEAIEARETPTPAPSASPPPIAAPAPNWNDLPVAANDAAGLSQQLVMLETAIHDPNVIGPQLAYSRLQDYPNGRTACSPRSPTKRVRR